MTTKAAKGLVKRCEARTRRGTLCQREAGWGTNHVGRGRCKLHGGCTPDHVRSAAREEAHEFLVGQLGYEVQIDPLDGALWAVHLAAGAVHFWKAELAKAAEASEDPSPRMVEGYRMAIQDLARMSDAASKAGVAERLITITERMAEQISLAFEEAAQAMKLDAQTRAIGVAAFGSALARFEGSEQPLALQAGEDDHA